MIVPNGLCTQYADPGPELMQKKGYPKLPLHMGVLLLMCKETCNLLALPAHGKQSHAVHCCCRVFTVSVKFSGTKVSLHVLILHQSCGHIALCACKHQQLPALVYCLLISLSAAMAQLSVQHCITMSSKQWKLPDNMIKEKEGGGYWLQLRASCFGLCNLLSTGKVDPKARPTIKDSVGYKSLVEKRNAKVFGESPDALFGEEAAEPAAKKSRKSIERLSPDEPLDIQLNDGAILVIKSCARPTDDLVIGYTHDNVNMFFYYMQELGVQITTEGQGKRTYSRTGEHSKNAAELAGHGDKNE